MDIARKLLTAICGDRTPKMFTLEQGGRGLDLADHPCRLNFSRLSGSDGWRVIHGDVAVAEVNWLEVGSFVIQNQGVWPDVQIIPCKNHIVPAVLGRLNRLLKAGDPFLVVVTPGVTQ